MKIRDWFVGAVGDSIAAEVAPWPSDDAAEVEREVTRLFDELRAPALRHLFGMGLAPADGEEVVQEVFLALFHHLRKGRPRSNLRGWVFRTAHNLGLKARRSAHKRQAAVAGGEAADSLADDRPDVERQVASRQRLVKIRAVADALPERDRFCLSLRAEGLSYREIAGALGMSLGAVSISIARSVARMREADR